MAEQEKKSSVFREKSLERISSPEKLDDYIKVSNPSVWIIIIALFALLGGFSYWGFAGRLPTTVQASGVSVGTETSSTVDTLYCLINQEAYSKILTFQQEKEEKQLSDMEVRVTPTGTGSKEGYITGKIQKMGQGLLSREAAVAQLGDAAIVDSIMPESGYGVLAVIKLDHDSNDKKKLHWSGGDGDKTLLAEEICSVSIVVDEDAPKNFLFG